MYDLFIAVQCRVPVGFCLSFQSDSMSDLNKVELWLTFFFLLDYLLYLYCAENKLKHVFQTMHIIDFVTILPGTVFRSIFIDD